MPNMRSRKAKGEARFWARRHRLVAQGQPLDPRTSKRFEREFELALQQRGAEAKEAARVRALAA